MTAVLPWITAVLGAGLGGGTAVLARKKLPGYFRESGFLASAWLLGFLTAIVSGVAWFLAVWFFREAGPTVLVAAMFAVVSPTLVATDAGKHLLPNRILGAVTVVELLVLLGGVLAAGVFFDGTSSAASGWPVLVRGLVGALGFTAVMFILTLLRTGLGLGDVKLAFPLGLMLASQSWTCLVFGVALGWILAGVAAIVLLITKRAGRKTLIAYGPYMIIGAWIVWLTEILT